MNVKHQNRYENFFFLKICRFIDNVPKHTSGCWIINLTSTNYLFYTNLYLYNLFIYTYLY